MQKGYLIQLQLPPKLADGPFSFNGTLKASKEFIAILDYGLSRLSAENLELKKQMMSILIKKTQTLEELMQLGNKHQIQSSLYELEQEGFITRKVQKGEEFNIFSYEFNRASLLFKIQKELEDNYEKYKEQRDYYNANVLFYCKKCNKLFEYTSAMENTFQCCGEPLQSFDSSEAIKNLTANMAYIEVKLNSFAKI